LVQRAYIMVKYMRRRSEYAYTFLDLGTVGFYKTTSQAWRFNLGDSFEWKRGP